MKYEQFYKQVYAKDFAVDEIPHGWIQWKGTEVCMDLHCECGHHGHFDGDFFYFFECPACKQKYAVGQNVALIPLNEEQTQFIENDHMGFQTCELDENED